MRNYNRSLGLSRNFLETIVTHKWVIHPFSLIQNRSGDFGDSILPLSNAVHCNRSRSALQPPLHCTASVPALHCLTLTCTVKDAFGGIPFPMVFPNEPSLAFHAEHRLYFVKRAIKTPTRQTNKKSVYLAGVGYWEVILPSNTRLRWKLGSRRFYIDYQSFAS